MQQCKPTVYSSKWHLWLLWSTPIKYPNIKNVTLERPQVSSSTEGAPLEKPGHLNKVLPFLLTALWHLHGSDGGRFMSLVKRWTCWVTARVFDPLWETAHKKQPLCGSFWKLQGVCAAAIDDNKWCVQQNIFIPRESEWRSLLSKLATRRQAHFKRPTICPYLDLHYCFCNQQWKKNILVSPLFGSSYKKQTFTGFTLHV